MREKGMNSFKHVQVAWSHVSNIEEQRMVEQRYLDQLKPTLNMVRAYNSKEDTKKYAKQYYEEHKEPKEPKEPKTSKEYTKRYTEKHRNMQTCICGVEYNYGRKYSIERHYESTKHQDHVQLIWSKLNPE